MALLSLSSAFATVDYAPLRGPYKLPAVTLAASTCEFVSIDESHLNRDLRLRLYALSPDEMKIFVARRRLLLEEAGDRLVNHINKLGWYEAKRQCLFKNESRTLKFARDAAVEIIKVLVSADPINLTDENKASERNLPEVVAGLTQHDLGILVFKDVMEVIDKRIIENAKAITACKQFGFCTGIGMKAGFGYRRAFVGFGGFLSRDMVRSFDKDAKWSTHYNIDIEVGKRAVTPSISLFFGLRGYIHFDRVSSDEITDFKTVYYPGFPISIHSPDTVGVGGTLGIAGIPIVSNFAWFESHMIRAKPSLKALRSSCEAVLSIVKDKFAPIEQVQRRSPHFPPDDIQ